MSPDQRAQKFLLEDVHFELNLMETTLEELSSLAADVQGRAPSLRERTAAGAFLAQFYSGDADKDRIQELHTRAPV